MPQHPVTRQLRWTLLAAPLAGALVLSGCAGGDTASDGGDAAADEGFSIMVAVAQLASAQQRFAEVQNAFRRFGMDIVRASVLRAQEQGYGADLDPDHIALAISLLFENFTGVYLRPDAAALGVRTSDEDAIRTLATIWKKTLYGY